MTDTKANTQPVICTLGDSHAKYFLPTEYYIGRIGVPRPMPYRIHGQIIAKASLAGFRPGVSTLNVKQKVFDTLKSAERLVLAFGQVDLELGYYYRIAVKGEALTPERYVEWLVGIYRDFLESIDTGACQLVLKGVNLTALTPRPFSRQYVARIVVSEGEVSKDEREKIVGPHILRERDQNAMHLAFNAAVRSLAKARGHGYFDLTRETRARGRLGFARREVRLDERYRTAKFDHHLADTVPVRRMHYLAAGRAFGLL